MNVFIAAAPAEHVALCLIAALSSSCASVPAPTDAVPIQWTQLETQNQVDDTCRGDTLIGRAPRFYSHLPNTNTLGCYVRMLNGVCRIITTRLLTALGSTEAQFHARDGTLFRTIGHELVHCFLGNFHAGDPR